MKEVLITTFGILSILAGIGLYTKLKNKQDKNIIKKKVYMDMDGNNDDYVAFLLLLNVPNVDLVGVAITPADCFPDVAKEFVSKIFRKRGLKIPIVVSDVDPVNDFPDDFKQLPLKSNFLPTLLNIEYSDENELKIDAAEHIYSTAKKIYEDSKGKEKLTLLITGPPSTLVKALNNHSDLKDYIDEVFWMGGAIEVGGNVPASPHSEYNAHWDPQSTKNFIESGIPIKIISLDATNSVPVVEVLLSGLAVNSKKYDASNLANELFAIAIFFDENNFDTYYAWDCLASMALVYNDLITFKEAEVDVITEKSEVDNQQGRIILKEGSKHFVNYSLPLDPEALEYFHKAFTKTFKYNL